MESSKIEESEENLVPKEMDPPNFGEVSLFYF